MSNKTLSDDACYVFTRLAAPLSFNSPARFLGFESLAHSDVTCIKYRFFRFKDLYWYSIILQNGHVANSLFFVGFSNCVRDFRSLCDAMKWELEDSIGLSDFVERYLKSKSTWRN